MMANGHVSGDRLRITRGNEESQLALDAVGERRAWGMLGRVPEAGGVHDAPAHERLVMRLAMGDLGPERLQERARVENRFRVQDLDHVLLGLGDGHLPAVRVGDVDLLARVGRGERLPRLGRQGRVDRLERPLLVLDPVSHLGPDVLRRRGWAEGPESASAPRTLLRRLTDDGPDERLRTWRLTKTFFCHPPSFFPKPFHVSAALFVAFVTSESLTGSPSGVVCGPCCFFGCR